jgi:pantoate--beta-alanine ligase
MIIARTPGEAREAVSKLRERGEKVGFVPTMGDLHEGHLSLVRMSLEELDRTVVSIFVNPTQFGPSEDFNRYPRDHERDLRILDEVGCDMVFIPATRDVYSVNDRTRVSVKGITDNLCGRFRPGHFDGVSLIIAKLFNIISPDTAFFGQKDAQQAVVLQRMASDLDFDVRIRLGPVIREENGLALSSRNRYLDGDAKKKAGSIFASLSGALALVKEGERDPSVIRGHLRESIEKAGLEVQYAEVVDGATMKALTKIEGIVLIAVAAWLDKVRLIDNIAVKVDDDSVEEVLLEFPEWSRYE